MSGKPVLVFIAKSVGFSIVFWLLWVFCFRPLTAVANDPAAQAREVKEQADAAALQNSYKRQLDQADIAIKRQEVLMDRWEKVIERWEAVSPKSK